ncbi:TPA: hypothetical protein ACID0S_006525, partial [Pseudomonas aeruginosa]
DESASCAWLPTLQTLLSCQARSVPRFNSGFAQRLYNLCALSLLSLDVNDATAIANVTPAPL